MDLTKLGGFNSIINTTMANIIKDIRESQLPVGVIYYMLKDIAINIEHEYNIALQEEERNVKAMEESQQQQQEEQNEEN